MGRHSRRGPAPKGGTADQSGRPAPGGSSGFAQAGRPPQWTTGLPAQQQRPPQGYGPPPAHGAEGYGTPADGHPDGTTPAHGVPRLPDGWLPDGTPAHGFPRLPDGTPAHGFPPLADGTPARGVPRPPDGTPAHGGPRTRGGHPEQREPGGGWGTSDGRTAAGYGTPAGPAAPLPRQRQAPPGAPRQDYVDAFDEDTDLFSPRTPASPDPYAAVTDWSAAPSTGIPSGRADGTPPAGEPASAKGGKGRAFTGIAAAAVTTVLAVVVAGQVADERGGTDVQAQSTGDQARDVRDSASRGDERETPAAPLTYAQKMDRTYPLSAARDGTGKFDAIPGIAKAPGKGEKFTYRVDVEQGLELDGALFAEAVQKTLNDNRSWAHNGARTFERIHSGQPDFVITLASPDTTAEWCAKSGLDTTVDNVSCDSAATERVMINADRWARGSETYGDEIHAYRQMLINHEIGHRLGFNHVTCDKDGDLAPVMQQQSKFLDHDGITCRPNPWAYPQS